MEHSNSISSADLLGIIILFFLIYLIKRNKHMHTGRASNYIYVVYLTTLVIILELVSGMLGCIKYDYINNVAGIIIAMNFSIMLIIPVLMAAVYSNWVYRYKMLLFIPVGLGIIFSFLSIWTEWSFYVDDNVIYHRGSFFYINVILALYGFAVLIISHNELSKEFDESEKVYLRLLYLIVIAASLIQVVERRQQIMWSGIATAELLYYIFLSEIRLKYDAVTDVRNRYSFEQKLAEILPDNSLFLIEFDVNNLKIVNDTCGHKAGDDFLISSVKIMKQAYHDCGILYRIGGDEFVVIAENCNEQKVIAARKKMLALIDERQKKYAVAYYIANAYSRFDVSKHINVYSCLREVDAKMYEDKAKSKTELENN